MVGFIVLPSSRDVRIDDQENANCDTDRPMIINENGNTKVVYTYHVKWKVHLPSLGGIC